MKQSQLIISTGKWYETIGDSLVLITERVDENDIAYIDGARFRDLGGGTYDENGHAIAAWVTDSLSQFAYDETDALSHHLIAKSSLSAIVGMREDYFNKKQKTGGGLIGIVRRALSHGNQNAHSGGGTSNWAAAVRLSALRKRGGLDTPTH